LINELISPPKKNQSANKKINHVKEMLDEYFTELVARN